MRDEVRLAEAVQWLENNGWTSWSDEDAREASGLVEDLQWLESNGWISWSEDDVKDVRQFVSDLQYLESIGEDASPERMQQVREMAALTAGC